MLLFFFHSDTLLDSAWLWQCGCSSNNAQYERVFLENPFALIVLSVALLANLPGETSKIKDRNLMLMVASESHMAVGTGFGQLFRGIGMLGIVFLHR